MSRLKKSAETNAKARVKFIREIELATSSYFSAVLGETIIKSLRKKSEQGLIPAKRKRSK